VVKSFFAVARIAVTIGILGYLISRVGLLTAYEHLVSSDLVYLALGTLILAFQPVIGAIRWMVILNALEEPVSSGQIIRWNYVGVFFGQILPATVGADAIRVWLAGRKKSDWRVPLVSVVLDRILMLLVLAVLLLVGLPYVSQMVGSPWVGYLVPVFALLGVVGVVGLALSDRLPINYDGHRLLRALRYLAEGVRSLASKPVASILGLFISILSYIGLMTSVYFFALAFGGSAGFLEMMVLLPPVLVASMLPVSIGGWGTRELAMVAALSLVGISESSALLSSIWLGISSILIALPGAVYFVFQKMDLHEMNQSDVFADAYGEKGND
jgi:glycosyltransferase 2 family protein